VVSDPAATRAVTADSDPSDEAGRFDPTGEERSSSPADSVAEDNVSNRRRTGSPT
jgi:hypothetical protein